MSFEVIPAIVLALWAGAAVMFIVVASRVTFLDAIESKLTRKIALQSAVAQLMAAVIVVVCAAGTAAPLQM